jgi:CheY-like chemotaxis protein
MSHEIRNPMNGILGSAMALADTSLDRRQGELVSTLHHCATFLASLVEDVLDFASIESGSFTPQLNPYSPAEMLDAVAAMLAEEAASSGSHFLVTVDSALPGRLVGDSARIQQIVVNYATNALKFGGGGRVQLSARAEGEDVVFSVSDSGPGISPGEQTALFSRFTRLKAARHAKVPGTGLGLAVCKMLAERMGASVGVTSERGHGATFFLRMPRVGALAEDKAAVPGIPGRTAHALVVEDIDYNADALCTMLGKMGFASEVARNGQEALGLAAEGAFQVVFVDCDLPGMSGLEVTRRLREREAGLSRMFIVATTAYSTLQDREECLRAGMDAFLGKPITPEKLKSVLSAWMRPQQAAQPVEAPPSGPQGDLSLLAYLTDGSRGALDREVDRFLGSLGSAACEVLYALSNQSRPGLARGAHKVVSHAHMIGSESLARAAEELELKAPIAEFSELERLAANLAARITSLRDTLPRRRPADRPE